MDDADRAVQRQEFEAELALKKRASVVRKTSDDCIECGVRISKARQKATGGTEYCVYCLELIEDE